MRFTESQGRMEEPPVQPLHLHGFIIMTEEEEKKLT
jgi:hypothetical protein